MFRPDAGLPLRFARTVLVPFGPLIVAIALGNSMRLGEQVYGFILIAAMAWFFCSLILVPALLFRADASPGLPTDEDGGGSGGPRESPPRDSGPAGILPDAEQSSERVRDHVRRKRRRLRRTAREPEPASSPKVHG